MKRVYSVTICGKNDCVVMTEAEASMIAMKYGKHIAMYDMTTRHHMKPEHLQKAQRYEQREWAGRGVSFSKGIKVGKFGGAAPVDWTYEDLINVKLEALNG
jgi:hypothetical protein|tara:strand:- start:1246 stop:1548 length:303 start_codon:yes stop_codon:yes gene_type:complete